MDKLNKTFIKGNVLKAEELNMLVSKVNELIGEDYSKLKLGTETGTAYDGGSGAALEQLVRELAGGGGAMYSVYLKNNLDSLSFASQYGEECIIDFTFISQYRDNLNEPYKQTGENGMCTILVKNGKYTDFTVVRQFEVSSGVSITQDIQEYLYAGANNVKITVKGENTDKETSPLTYSVQLTSLGVSANNFAWWTAFSGNITLPLIISGNISKVLHVAVNGLDYNEVYTENLGTAVYVDTPYNYIVPHPSQSGIYTVTVYLSNQDNTIQTKSLSYHIMCVNDGEDIKLMCINNVASQLTNWQDNTVFHYSIYNGQSSYSDALFTITKDGDGIYSSEDDAILTNTDNIFNYPMEVDTDDDSNFNVTVHVTSDNSDLINPITLSVLNGLGFSATSGAVLYLNPKTRSNSQNNKKSVINEVDKSLIGVSWSNMNWGSDGWVTDNNGNKALKVLSGSKAILDYQPFTVECARTGKTIELDYMVDNVADSSIDIVKIFDNNVGLRISGENISMYSQSCKDSTTQDVPTDNGVRIRVTVVIQPNTYGNQGFNIVAVYINGKKNRQYAYESNDYFKHNGKIELGNDYADLYVYGVRVYDGALTSEAVQKNYINQLVTVAEKTKEKLDNDVLDAEATQIDFENTRDQYNVFVFDNTFPNLNNPGGVSGSLSVYFHDKPEMNFTVNNLLCEGQGTSSKKYYEWNMRWKLNGLKDANGNKLDSVATYANGTTEAKKVRMFTGVPKMNKITAKKNWASSMQDHKAGSVAAFNDLGKAVGITNEAIAANPDVRIAVYQEPFIGFSKSVNEEGQDVYTCMGEFTIGPDKGDSACFGYDTDTYPNLISVEGSDNAPLGALFRVPWNRSKSYWKYNADEEAFQYNNTNCWDFDAGELNASETEPLSTQEWVDAYNLVYLCSDRIRPFDGTIEQLNAELVTYRSSGYEYWTPDYNLWYYEAAEGQFIASDIGDGPVNLKTQLSSYLNGWSESLDNDAKNRLFIDARIAKFKTEISSAWDVDDALFHSCFVLFTAGTDQRAKNTYPYSFCTGNSKWKWRVDDADTILSIDNQGQDRKPYYAEIHDYYSNGQPIWNGETSVFWNLLELAFADEYKAMMRSMLSAMEDLSDVKSGTPYDKVYGFYEKYYLGIKNYFPSSVVNADAKRFEIAKLAYNNGTYTNDTDPITQSHGDFYSAETAWIKKRIMYIMSWCTYGLFGTDSNDSITYRASGDNIDYELTPAVTMYPSITNGTSIVAGPRTKAGEVCKMTIDLGGSSDQQNAINGASWLRSIGDWHKKNVSGTMTVRGKRLQELILGSKTENVIISITALTIADCKAMKRILLSNIFTLQGVLDLRACLNMRKVYADGTSLSQIKLPEGGALDYVEYPATNMYLLLKNFPVLTAEGLIIDQCAENITDYMIQECPNLNSMEILVQIMMAQKDQAEHHLKRVRAVGFVANFTDNGTEVLDFLANLSDGSYEGLNSDGIAGDETKPVLDGTINVKANVYEDSVNLLKAYFDRLTLHVIGEFYVRFQDSEVFKLVMDNWFSNRKGVTKTDLSTITNFGQVFKNNTSIKYFNEAQYTSLANLDSNSVFEGCGNLKEMTLPPTLVSMRTNSTFNYCVMDKLEILNGDGSKGLILSGDPIATGITLKKLILPERTILLNNYWARGNAIDEIYLYAKTPPTLNIAYGDSLGNKVLYVPCESLSAYEIATNYSNFEKIKPIPVDRLDTISIIYKNSVLEVVYTPYYTSLRDVTWEIISGNEFATIDAATGKLTVLENADNSPVTVKATSNYNSLITATLDINVTYAPFTIPIYEIPEEFIGNGNSSYIDTGLTWDDLNDIDYTIIVNASLGTYSNNATIFSLLREASPYPGVSFGCGDNASRGRFVYGWSGVKFEFPYSDGTYILVKSGSTFKMYSYLDSTLSLLKEDTGTYSSASYPSKLIVGAAEDGSYNKFRYWNGRISRFEVYNKALNEEDIHNCIAAPLLRMDIEYNNSKCTINYHPRYTNETGVVWEITEGSEYAMITPNGLVIPLVGANNSEVTVKATSTYHPSITATKKITVTYVETGGLNGAIQSTGNRYIKTDICFPNLSNTKVEAKFAFLSSPTGMPFGCRTSSDASNKVGAYFNSMKKCNFMLGGRASGDIDITLNSDYNMMSIDSDGITLNGKSLSFSNPTAEITNNTDFPLWIFANNNGGGIHGLLNNTTKIWYVKIWEEGELVHNLVPNIDADGIVGLRDTKTGMVYNPIGTLTYIED